MIEGVSITNGQNGIDSSGTLNRSLHAKHTVTAVDGNGFQFNALSQEMQVHLVI